ncbi:ATP-dependent DNA helicase RecG [Arenicella xantha]|uniref:ATP-dependent DNA helicase RecG n=1 Tax=Arenicella xantha TaxID=644221 RepID=A0A395JGR6_9GAMM|nr:ATP-dependent DNA helicase RecG [Arenicella xantha]RBP48931.1 ATP-dependent DNA helicase RecG [Arenicella xantha]
MALALIDPVTELTGVGPQLAGKLERLHVRRVQDVLFHLPLRYEDRTHVTELGALLPNLSTVVIGQIDVAQVVFGRRRSLLVHISDGTGSLTIRMFYFNRAQEKSFQRGLWVKCFGEVRPGLKGYEMIHPEYRISADEPEGGLDSTLTPVYPTTEGVSQALWRKLTDQVLAGALQNVDELVAIECLPAKFQAAYEAATLQEALKALHRPQAGVDLAAMQQAGSAAHQRLIIEELLAHHFSIRRSRSLRAHEQAPAMRKDIDLENRFLANLGFTLTGAQTRVSQEVAQDLANQSPAMRLIQGDVGSGKTVIAAMAMLQAVSAGTQTVLMAPTELLAEQHFRTLSDWFGALGISIGWLASKTPAKEKRQTLEQLASGELLVAVGTHALIQESVVYQNLGLVVIDEQHRFGVEQRLALRAKTPAGKVPHQLAMTATPIPRTLAMTFYADLDVSSIDELPPGRKVVETVVIPAASRRDEVIERVRQACQQGRQVYWVCPLIDESEVLEAQAATDTAEELSKRLSGLRIGLVHGRLKSKEKELVMSHFRAGEVDLLVATTVIEVGVDVPNASLMVIENAERMGLAQLHQLRGRVGRGSEQSFCLLLYQQPLSQHAKARLKTLRETNDGFVIAEKDLEIRGAGELLGTRQTGSISFKVADLIRDQHLLPSIEGIAVAVEKTTPQNVDALIERWVGTKEDYVNA